MTGVLVASSSALPFRGTFATFTTTLATASASDFVATVSFGDGRSAPGVITPGANGVFVVSAAHQYAHPGLYHATVTVTVTGPGGARATAPDLALVSPPPAVVGLRRPGVHDRLTRLVLAFNRPLNAATAQDVRNYLFIPADPSGRPLRYTKSIPVAVAAYDPRLRTVTLTPASPLRLTGSYLLRVNGAGPGRLVDVLGAPLVGTNTGGRPGNYLALIHGYCV